MMKDKRASHTTRGKDSSYKAEQRHRQKRKASEEHAGKKEKSRPAQGRKKARH